MRLADSIVPLSEARLKRMLDHVMYQYVDSREWKIEKGYLSMALESYRFYRGVPIARPAGYEHIPNYWRPLTFSAVETILPRVAAGIYATDPFMRYMGIRDQDHSGADNLTKFVDYKLKYEVPFMLQTIKAFKNALIFGWSMVYHPWLYKSKTRFSRDLNDSAKRIKIQQTVINAPWCRAISIWDAYPQAGLDSIYNADNTIFREYVTPSQLYQRSLHPRSPYFVEQVAKILKNKEEDSYPQVNSPYYPELDALVGIGEGKRQKKIELLHYIGTYDLDSDDKPEFSSMEVHIVIANRIHVVAAGPNPYDSQERPLTEFRPVPNTHGLLGIPIPMMGRDTQLEANDQMNFRLAQQDFSGNKVVKIKRHSDIYDKLQGGDFILYPGATIPVDDMDDVGVVDFGNMDPSLYTEDNITASMYDKALGIHDITSGKGDPRSRTATGTSLVIREANYRFDLILKNMIPDMTRMMHKIGMDCQQLGIDVSPVEQTSLANILYPNQLNKHAFKRNEIQAAFQTLMLSSSTRGDRSYHFALLQSLRAQVVNSPHINMAEFDKQLFEEGELKNLDILIKKMPPATPNPSLVPVGGGVPGTGASGVGGGMQGLGGPTEQKNLSNTLTMMARDGVQ